MRLGLLNLSRKKRCPRRGDSYIESYEIMNSDVEKCQVNIE